LTRFGEKAFSFGHFALISLMRGTREAQQRFQMTKGSTA
jgi:hypothetical protein